MSRPPLQTLQCVERDLEWLLRIKKRARNNTERSDGEHRKLVGGLNDAISVLQAEVDAQARAPRRQQRKAS